MLMNLNTKEKTEIEAGSGEYIAPLGFMEEDLILVLPMRRMCKTIQEIFFFQCIVLIFRMKTEKF